MRASSCVLPFILMAQFRLPPALPRIAQNKAPLAFAWTLAVAALAWPIGSALARFAAPAPVPFAATAPRLTPQEASRIVGEHKLFGEAAVASSGAAASGAVQLIGLMTGPQGFALVSDGATPVRPVVAGEEMSPGVRVVRIQARAIEIDAGGQVQVVRLPENALDR